MRTRAAQSLLASLLYAVAAAGTAACSPDMAGGGAGGGGGKADGVCETEPATYMSWLSDIFMPGLREIGFKQSDFVADEAGMAAARALTADAPCGTGDEAYVAWWKMSESNWSGAAQARRAARDAFLAEPAASRDFAAYQARLAGAIPLRTRQLLEAQLLVVPREVGLRGYAVWLKEYASTLDFVLGLEASVNPVRIYEDWLVVSPAEETHLAWIERARPETTAEGAWAEWFKVYTTHLDHALAATVTPEVNEVEAAGLLRVQVAMPARGGEVDALSWLAAAKDAFEGAYRSVGASGALYLPRLAALESIQPDAGGPRAYRAWFGVYADALASAADDAAFSADEQTALERWAALRPCGVDDDGQAAYDRLAARRAAIAQVSEAVAVTIDASAPVACAADPAQEPKQD